MGILSRASLLPMLFPAVFSSLSDVVEALTYRDGPGTPASPDSFATLFLNKRFTALAAQMEELKKAVTNVQEKEKGEVRTVSLE